MADAADPRPLIPTEFVEVLHDLPGTSVDPAGGAYTRCCCARQTVKARRGDREPLSEDAFLRAICEFGGVTTECPDEIAVRYLQQLRDAR